MPSFQGVLSKLVVLGSQTPCNYGPKKSTSTDFLPMHSTMLSGSLGTRIIQKNKEKTSVPRCFALETPMHSHAQKTRAARLHVNGGILIPQRGTFGFPGSRKNVFPRTGFRPCLELGGYAELVPVLTQSCVKKGNRSELQQRMRRLRRRKRRLRRRGRRPRPFFFSACPPGSPPCCGPGRRRRHRTPCFTWHPSTGKNPAQKRMQVTSEIKNPHLYTHSPLPWTILKRSAGTQKRITVVFSISKRKREQREQPSQDKAVPSGGL